ncbi:MAG: hypothetical protein ACPGU9_06605 [Flavobacteriaceae bacterium]
MKKIIFVLVCCSLSFISCEDDNSVNTRTPDSSLSAKIDDIVYVFDDISVVRTPYEDGGVAYVDVYVTAKISSDANREFQFYIDELLVGENEILYFMFEKDQVLYEFSDYQPSDDTASMTSMISENNGSRLKGTFSGNLTNYNTTTMSYETITVSNGSFDVRY